MELELELELELVELELLDALSEDVAVPDPLLEELSAAVADAELVASGVSAVGLKKKHQKIDRRRNCYEYREYDSQDFASCHMGIGSSMAHLAPRALFSCPQL